LGWAEPTSSRARLTSQRKKGTKEHAHGIEMKELTSTPSLLS